MGRPLDVRLRNLRSLGPLYNASPTTLPNRLHKSLGRIRRPLTRYPLPKTADQHQERLPSKIRIQACEGDGKDARGVENGFGGEASLWDRRLWKYLEDRGADGRRRMGSGSQTVLAFEISFLD